jgi:hypothetical protein
MFTFYNSCLDKQKREASKSDGLFAHLRAAKFNPNKLHLFNTEWCLNTFPFVPFFNVESTWDVRPGTKAKSWFKISEENLENIYLKIQGIKVEFGSKKLFSAFNNFRQKKTISFKKFI